MSKKLKKNDEYPLPEGCMAIQIKNANVDYSIEHELITYPKSSVTKSVVDDFCNYQHVVDSLFRLTANTQENIIFLTGEPSGQFPNLFGKDILIIITDEEE